jgi:MscS family membrane protein
LLKHKRQGNSKSRSWRCLLELAFALSLVLGAALPSPAQLRKPAVAPPPKADQAPADPLGRETPRGALLGLLKYGERDDFTTAARYLQLPADFNLSIEQLAKEMVAMRHKFNSDIALLSDDPKGSIEAGLPPGQVRAGELKIGGATLEVILVRVDDPDSGKIWLISQETVKRIPDFYALAQREKPELIDRLFPAALTQRRILAMSLAQWLGWLLSIPISWLLAWPIGFLLSVPGRAWSKLRGIESHPLWDTPIEVPLRCIIAIVLHGVIVYLLEPPLLYRSYYFRLLAALLAAAFAWLAARFADRGFVHVVNRTRTQTAGRESIVILIQRLTRIALLATAFLCALALLGVNVTTTLAGLGIGGLAIALAAQKSLENLIGGVSLLMDRAVHVGDVCQIGGRLGTVEDIGLRSLKLRTTDQNLLVVPNGVLAQMQFESMRTRRKLLINQIFLLRIETRAEQLRLVVTRVQSMLDELPIIESGNSRIRVNKFDGAAFELELFCYAKTTDWLAFTALRQDVVIKIAEIVETSGTQFAAPTQLSYQAGDFAVDSDRAHLGLPEQFENANAEPLA